MLTPCPAAAGQEGARWTAETGGAEYGVYAAQRLADLLAERGDLDGLRDRIDAGDRRAARRLAGYWPDRAGAGRHSACAGSA
jgi:hypothetical protein